jgi:hypothetical protein
MGPMQQQSGFLIYGLSTIAIVSATLPSQAHQSLHRSSASPTAGLVAQASGVPVQGCLTRPKQAPPEPNLETQFVPGALTLDRFRQQPTPPALSAEATRTNASQATLDYVARHRPVERIALAHPTNFGERYLFDYSGQPANRAPIIVLHETVSSGPETLKLFQTNHPKNAQQASYHTLIMRDGTIYYLVPPDKRAFGAGTSVFSGPSGAESVSTNPSLSASVNNFAYHISFVSPQDGRRSDRSNHSGYTSAQYYSLAWLAAKTGVPVDRITTHQAVDRAGNRTDPRSFNRAGFLSLLRLYPKTNEIVIGCPGQSQSNPLQR